MNTILAIPADKKGNKLFIKDLTVKNDILSCKYRSTYNDMPFMETDLYIIDNGQNLAICGTDGTVLFRFSVKWLDKLN